MSLLDWFRKDERVGRPRFWDCFRRTPREDARLTRWKMDWTAAVAAPDTGRLRSLAAALDQLGLSDEDLAIEREMLDGVRMLVDVTAAVAAAGLPIVETGHRVVGSDCCHFTAPASMPDEPGQPGGRLLLTSGRAILLGGAAARTIAWHMVGEAIQVERDLLLVRVDRAHLYRFRLNSFADSLCGTFVAKRLLGRRK